MQRISYTLDQPNELHLDFVGPQNSNAVGKLSCATLCVWLFESARVAAAKERFGGFEYPAGVYRLKDLAVTIFGHGSPREDIDVRIDDMTFVDGVLTVKATLVAGHRVRKGLQYLYSMLRLSSAPTSQRDVASGSIRLVMCESAEEATRSDHLLQMLKTWTSMATHCAVRVGAEHPTAVPVTAKLVIKAYRSPPEGTTDWAELQPAVELSSAKRFVFTAMAKKRVPNCGITSSFLQKNRLHDGHESAIAEGSVKVVLLGWNLFTGFTPREIHKTFMQCP